MMKRLQFTFNLVRYPEVVDSDPHIFSLSRVPLVDVVTLKLEALRICRHDF